MSPEEPLATVFAVAVAVAATLAILGAHAGCRYRWVHYVFKPLATGLILLMAVVLPSQLDTQYRVAIIAGLVLSLTGDVFLMLPQDHFVRGLVSFLLAHVAYLVAFAKGVPGAGAVLATGGYLGLAGVLVGVLWSRIPTGLRGPVVVYVVVICSMAGTALARWHVGGVPGTLEAAFGALLFVVSDSILAWDRFMGSLGAGRAITLAAYFPAQYLIALSVSS